jgi:F420-non-reducing hydrogenase iron-sulfur subunit
MRLLRTYRLQASVLISEIHINEMRVGRMNGSADITMFVCANCARPGVEAMAAAGMRPLIPDFHLPGQVEQVVVPCTGRLQPEHLLRAFETGSSIVSVVACSEENCHHAEGSRRCSLRVEYVQSILREIGLGDGRLVFLRLPGSAAEDLQVSAGKGSSFSPGALEARIVALRDRIVEAFNAYPSNPLLCCSAAQGGNNE